MKYLILALLAVAFNANATYCPDGSLIASHPNHDCNYKLPTPATSPNAQTQTQQQTQTAQTNGTAKSKSDASSQSSLNSSIKSDNSATGGSANNSLGPMGNDNSQTSFKAFALSLPTPVFTPPLPTIAECPGANVTQDAVAVGWNFFSKAHGEINTDNCSIMRIYNLMIESCRYETARQLLNKFTEKLMPGIEYTRTELIDLTPNECRLLKLPMPVVSVAPVNYLYTPSVESSCKRSDYAAARNNGTKVAQAGRKVQNKPAVKRTCS